MIFLFNSWFLSNIILWYIFMFLDQIFLQWSYFQLTYFLISMYLEFQVERLFCGQRKIIFLWPS